MVVGTKPLQGLNREEDTAKMNCTKDSWNGNTIHVDFNERKGWQWAALKNNETDVVTILNLMPM